MLGLLAIKPEHQHAISDKGALQVRMGACSAKPSIVLVVEAICCDCLMAMLRMGWSCVASSMMVDTHAPMCDRSCRTHNHLQLQRRSIVTVSAKPRGVLEELVPSEWQAGARCQHAQ